MEAVFLQTIQNEPENKLHWLVFADFLEEQGDPRAGSVRLWVNGESPEQPPDLTGMEERTAWKCAIEAVFMTMQCSDVSGAFRELMSRLLRRRWYLIGIPRLEFLDSDIMQEVSAVVCHLDTDWEHNSYIGLVAAAYHLLGFDGRRWNVTELGSHATPAAAIAAAVSDMWRLHATFIDRNPPELFEWNAQDGVCVVQASEEVNPIRIHVFESRATDFRLMTACYHLFGQNYREDRFRPEAVAE